MSQFLVVLQFLKAVGPLIAGLVDTVDAAMPAGSPGKAKLDAFEALLRQAVSTEQALAAQFDAAWPLVSALVGAVVNVRKALPAG